MNDKICGMTPDSQGEGCRYLAYYNSRAICFRDEVEKEYPLTIHYMREVFPPFRELLYDKYSIKKQDSFVAGDPEKAWKNKCKYYERR